MTLKICGMTLEEIDDKFNKFEAERKRQIKLYKAGKLPEQPSMPDFITNEEFEFAKKIYKPLNKAFYKISDRLNDAKNEEQKAELDEIFGKIVKIFFKCAEINERLPSL